MLPDQMLPDKCSPSNAPGQMLPVQMLPKTKCSPDQMLPVKCSPKPNAPRNQMLPGPNAPQNQMLPKKNALCQNAHEKNAPPKKCSMKPNTSFPAERAWNPDDLESQT